MSRLYARILMSLWAVMIAVAIGAVGVTWLVLIERHADLGRAPGDLSRAATVALSDGGEDGLRAWLQRAVVEHQEYHIYVVGPDGRELLARPLPPRAAFLLDRRGVEDRPPPPPPEHDGLRPPLAARLLPSRPVPVLVSANGAEYLLIVIPHQHGLGPLEEPGTRIGYFVVALLVTLIASLILTRSISRPVRALGAAARAIAGGNLSTRVDPPVSRRRDEIGALARDFDEMAERLKDQIDTKERLLQDVSHELRSPLARMRVALGLARQPGADQGTQLDRLDVEVERLDALIGQVLALSRLGRNAVRPHFEECELGDVIDGIARDASFEAQARRIRVDWRPPALPVNVQGDPALLGSAVENVVRNALRYTADGTTVSISLTASDAPTDRRASIVVRDQGPGVPEPELARIFEPFHRVAAARGRDTGGDGLGLAITDRVLRAHGGIARAANLPGGGLEVTLEMPCE